MQQNEINLSFVPVTPGLINEVEEWFDDPDTQRFLGRREWVPSHTVMLRGLVLLLSVVALSPAWTTEAVKCNDAGTQLELNACALDELSRADKELNDTYAALLKKESDDTVFIRKLRAAQRAWLAFRDAEVDATFACSEDDPRVCWGSMLPMSTSAYKAKLTRERTARLQRILIEGRPAD